MEAIESTLLQQPSIKHVVVSLKQSHHTVCITSYSPYIITSSQICSLINDIGYDACVAMAIPDTSINATTMNSNSSDPATILHATSDIVVVDITGMTCHSFVETIEQQMEDQPGIIYMAVSLKQHCSIMVYNPNMLNKMQICTLIEDMGFEAKILDAAVVSNQPALSDLHDEESREEMEVVAVNIAGMTCHSCVDAIKTGIGQHEGIMQAGVSLKRGNSVIQYNPRRMSREEVCVAISDMRFEATIADGTCTTDLPAAANSPAVATTMASVAVNIDGMTCHLCVDAIENHLSAQAGVNAIAVSLQRNNGLIAYYLDVFTQRHICVMINDMGFDATVGTSPSRRATGIINVPVEAQETSNHHNATSDPCCTKTNYTVNKGHAVSRSSSAEDLDIEAAEG